MPAITITPGSSTANVITLTFDAGALSAAVGYSAGPPVYPENGSYSYLLRGQTSLYYWSSAGGVPESGPVEATSLIISGATILSALKSVTRYSVLGGTVRTADFIQAGYTYVTHDIDLDTYYWCTSEGVTESPAVSAAPYADLVGTRYGIPWTVVDLLVTGGGTGTGTGTGTDTGTGTGT